MNKRKTYMTKIVITGIVDAKSEEDAAAILLKSVYDEKTRGVRIKHVKMYADRREEMEGQL